MTQTIATRQEEAVQEMLAAIAAWFDEQAARGGQEHTVRRTTLQAGVFNELLLDYQPGRASVDVDLGFGYAAPSQQPAFLSPAQLRDEIVPVLAQAVAGRVAAVADTALIDYCFRFRATFPSTEGPLELPVFDQVNEAKRQQLLARIASYLDTRLYNAKAGGYGGKPLESFFLTRHLLDPGLFPDLDAAWTIAQFERLQQPGKNGQAALAEHRRNIINAGTQWAEEVFLPRHFDVRRSEYRANEYALKPGAGTDGGDAGIDLLLYLAVMILRHEPGYSKPRGQRFIELAVQLGSERAKRMLVDGSGSIDHDASRLETAQTAGHANDVFATIRITIKEEAAPAYAQALAFVIRLLELGFPKSYQIRLQSGSRHYLDVKGLARSDTHRFFAQALRWPELHPLLARYARTAIEQYEFYLDTEGEKNCMPGSYATFGLALSDAQYFPLLHTYMAAVDEEHQSVQDSFTSALVARYGVTASSIGALAACLRHCSDNAKVKLAPALDDDASLALLCGQMQQWESHTVEHVAYIIWGKREKLAALARKTSGHRKTLLDQLLGLMPPTPR